MPDSKQRLIETATRSFSDDAEMKLAAAAFLEERLAADEEAAAALMVARWDEVDAAK
jgi:hypothetical protein